MRKSIIWKGKKPICKNGSLYIPVEVRKKLGLKYGDEVDMRIVSDGERWLLTACGSLVKKRGRKRKRGEK